MKRLTEADIDCEITEYDNKEDIYIKLSRYEDTELEPDEVDSLKEYVETLEEARKHSKFQLDVKKDELAKANNQIKELRDAFYTIHNIINQKKDLKYENEIIDISDMDREVAILIYEDKIYEDSNHQYALESALKDNGLSLDLNLDEDIDKAAALTNTLSKRNEIYTYDIFADGKTNYLISHSEDNLKLSLNLMKEYASQHNLILGTFLNFKDSTCKILGD